MLKGLMNRTGWCREENPLVRRENYSRSQILQNQSLGDYFIKSSGNHLKAPCLLKPMQRGSLESTQPNTSKSFTPTQRSRVNVKTPNVTV